MGELHQAQALAEEARLARGFSLGQDVQGNLLSRGIQAFGAGTQLEQLPMQLLGTSLEGGGAMAGVDRFNAANIYEASKLKADTESAFLSSTLGGLGGFAGTDFGTSFNDFFGIGGDVTGSTEGDFFGSGFGAGGGGTF